MKTVLVTGMPGSGKEEFIKIAKEMGYDIVRMGDVVRRWAKKNAIDMDDKGIGGFAHSERERHDYGIWAQRTLESITDKNTVIDGVRGQAEMDIFRNEIGEELTVVAVYASPMTRYQRLINRGRDDAPQNFTEFQNRDHRELKWGLGEVIALADYTLVNEYTLKNFHTKAKELLKTINDE